MNKEIKDDFDLYNAKYVPGLQGCLYACGMWEPF